MSTIETILSDYSKPALIEQFPQITEYVRDFVPYRDNYHQLNQIDKDYLLDKFLEIEHTDNDWLEILLIDDVKDLFVNFINSRQIMRGVLFKNAFRKTFVKWYEPTLEGIFDELKQIEEMENNPSSADEFFWDLADRTHDARLNQY